MLAERRPSVHRFTSASGHRRGRPRREPVRAPLRQHCSDATPLRHRPLENVEASCAEACSRAPLQSATTTHEASAAAPGTLPPTPHSIRGETYTREASMESTSSLHGAP